LSLSKILDGKEYLPYHKVEGGSMTTLTITAKGQITLKQELLRHLNVAPGQKIDADKLPDGRLVLQPAKRTGSIADFSGCLAKPGTPRLTIAQIKKITEEAWAGKR
jgi:bifunctional DNA-binding transcriptional regulator/antitoxin component of YhaV-PrlF toxin-antitoxin module